MAIERFMTTHWSIVLAAGDREAPDRDEALAYLCRTYWYPLYAFVRRRGSKPDEAEDLTPEILDLMTVVGTQLGRAFERRHATEERFRAVVDNMPAIVLLRDAAGRFIFVNRHYEDRYGVSLDEVVGKTPLEAEAETRRFLDADQSHVFDQQVIDSGRAVEYELELPDGTVLASVKFPVMNPVRRVVAVRRQVGVVVVVRAREVGPAAGEDEHAHEPEGHGPRERRAHAAEVDHHDGQLAFGWNARVSDRQLIRAQVNGDGPRARSRPRPTMR